MANAIHPTAIIEAGAKLGEGVSVGAYAYIGGQARVGARTTVHHHATVDGNTVLGEACEVFPYAFIGGKTQDLKYRGGDLGLAIGDRNVFREFVTVHQSTIDGTRTTLGHDNYLLAYTHVAHDCTIGNHLIMSNYAGLAGHVQVGDYVTIAGYAGFHQFCRIGDYAMAGAMSKVTQDIPPYMIAEGNPAEVRLVNRVGLQRHGFSDTDQAVARRMFKTLYREERNRREALALMDEWPEADHPMVRKLVAFARSTQRGLA
ncbi:MAG: acyl-ACP--UDP-N-acetylglucosamine O-acyltransferase [Opitutales bacterium]